MRQSPAIEAARNFLNVTWNGNQPSDAALCAALDKLLLAYHDIQPVEVSYSDLDPPRQERKTLYDEAAKRFTDYGLYSICDPLEVYDPSHMIGDAIDDIADITLDMRNTVWLGERLGAGHAGNWYRDFYFHWGLHVRELSLYLHARQFH